MRVVLLGTGTPNADPDRSGPSVAIVADGTPYIVDCGPGVVRRAAAALGRHEIPQLTRLFLTHLHSDHTAGLPDLILTPWVLGRSEPLEVRGPAGTESMVEQTLLAYRVDIEERLRGLQPTNKHGWRTPSYEVDDGTVYRDETIVVDATRVDHGGMDALAYRFRSRDRTIVVSGDTKPTPSLIRLATGCDVLVHEVYSVEGFKSLSQEWQEYHAAVHTSSVALAEIASAVRPGLLVLYHQLLWGVSEQDLLSEIGRQYDGAVVFGRDLEVY